MISTSNFLNDYHSGEVIFTHVFPDGTNLHIAVDRLERAIYALPKRPSITYIPVDPAFALSCVRQNAVNHARCQELSRLLATGRRKFKPVFIALDGTIADNGKPNGIFIDGRHRYVVAAAMHSPVIPAFLLEPSIWHPYRIELPSLTQAELASVRTDRPE